MMGAREKETQIDVTLVQGSVYQKLCKKIHLCSLVYIMQCFLSGGGTHIDDIDVTIAMPKTSECHQIFLVENVCTSQRLQPHLVLFCLLSFVN